MKKLRCILLIVISVFLYACDIGSGSESGSNETISRKPGFIDITNAKALLVIPSNNLSLAINGLSFAKETQNGTLVEVSIKDENGSGMDGIPSAIYDATNTYVIIIFENVPYLVNKLNGSAYDLSPGGIPEMLRANYGYNGYTRKSIYQDSSGNIYYINRGIVKK